MPTVKRQGKKLFLITGPEWPWVLGVLITSVVDTGVLIMVKTSGVVEVSRLHTTHGGLRVSP